MKRRNSLIELFRFIFAMNVVKNHGYFPYQGPYFGPGRISVEFFFILTGFLLVRSVDKYLDKPFWQGLRGFFWSKLKSILIPVLIAIPFNLWYSYLDGDGINLWGYLWYVNQMLIYIPIFFLVRYFIKNNNKFLLVIGIACIIATVLNMTNFFYEWGVIRAVMAISLGVLISHIPPLKIKNDFLKWMIVVPLMLLTFIILFYPTNLAIEKLAHLVVYPMLIYFTFQLTVHNVVLNYLGSLSFGLYAFQCIVRPIELMGYENVWVMFFIIVILTLLEDTCKRIYRFIKQRKHKKIKTVV